MDAIKGFVRAIGGQLRNCGRPRQEPLLMERRAAGFRAPDRAFERRGVGRNLL
ncbi:hypothetical protein JCM17846_24280 [Iodidimonas nitroreducens]|uniref:Uncharacterized protein n=1 Tax=Iodidimonas nitroreducens TaxID=1236968 RepID=A0A5A7NCS2_9PROT|nr:hypothetical protein JCM17846_24280 [Iodidimonas nitroreducens]